MPTLTEEAREQLHEQLKALDAAAEPILKAREPYNVALAAIDSVRDSLIGAAGVEPLEYCEGCSRLLIAGDLGHRCADGPVLCEACSPTFADLLKQYSEEGAAEDAEDPEGFALGLAAAQAAVDAGDGDKKHVLPLS